MVHEGKNAAAAIPESQFPAIARDLIPLLQSLGIDPFRKPTDAPWCMICNTGRRFGYTGPLHSAACGFYILLIETISL
jgi:hypothetical protein